MRPYLLLAAVVLAACQKAETNEQMMSRMRAESDSAKAAIDAINVRYVRYWNANQADSIAMLFTENGVMMPPNTRAITGRDSIRAWVSANGMPPGSTLTFAAVEVAANGPLAVERGTYTFTMPAQGRTPAMNTAGKYLAHWHTVNGTWALAAEMWSDDVPPPGGGN